VAVTRLAMECESECCQIPTIFLKIRNPIDLQTRLVAFSALTLLVGRQEGYPARKNMGDGGGGHWLVQMEWCPAGWSVCLPLLIFPYTIKSRSSLLALAVPGGSGKRAVKRLWCGDVVVTDSLKLDLD